MDRLACCGASGPGQDRDAVKGCGCAGLDLVAKEREDSWRRADEDQASVGAGAGKRGTFTEKAVARMDRLASALEGGLDQCLRVQIRGRTAPGQGVRPIASANMLRLRIVLRIHNGAAQPERCAGVRDADRDLATIGDQDRSRRHVGPTARPAQDRLNAVVRTGRPGLAQSRQPLAGRPASFLHVGRNHFPFAFLDL